MRTLVVNEINEVAGGSALFLLGAGSAAVAMISYFSAPRGQYVDAVTTYQIPFEKVTPVYDPAGVYVGDQIDSYMETKVINEKKWVPYN